MRKLCDDSGHNGLGYPRNFPYPYDTSPLGAPRCQKVYCGPTDIHRDCLLAISSTSIGGGVYRDDLNGQILALFVLSVAGVESALGLAIMVGLYRLRGNISFELLEDLKG
jgi:hypothetical protein